MAWIELHQNLPNHIKLKRVARDLKVEDRDLIRAKLENLWLWCLDYREDGVLRDMNAQDIADASNWNGEATLWVDTLIDRGFLDRARGGAKGSTLKVHDWWDFAGRLILQRKKNRERMRSKRASHNPDTEPLTLPTEPDQTNPTKPDPPQGDQFHGIVNALGFFKSPGWKAKRDAVAELVRLGISTDSIIAKAKTMEAQSMDFWEFMKWCRGQKTGAAKGVDGLRLPK